MVPSVTWSGYVPLKEKCSQTMILLTIYVLSRWCYFIYLFSIYEELVVGKMLKIHFDWTFFQKLEGFSKCLWANSSENLSVSPILNKSNFHGMWNFKIYSSLLIDILVTDIPVAFKSYRISFQVTIGFSFLSIISFFFFFYEEIFHETPI